MHATRREESLGRLLRGKPSSQSVKRVMKAISTNLGRRGLTLLPCCFSVRSTSFVPLNADLFFSCAFLFYFWGGAALLERAAITQSCHCDATRLDSLSRARQQTAAGSSSSKPMTYNLGKYVCPVELSYHVLTFMKM